ncbi:MAG: DUF2568 domain-containing protein, partial [Halobacteriaceae archaeon]
PMDVTVDRTNLALRAVLEVAALVAFGYWGWTTHAGSARVAWAVGAPVAVAAVWAVFRVPGDPGDAPVAVPGPVRLALEVVLFAAAASLLWAAGATVAAVVFGALVVGHYGLAGERVRWLLGA